MPRSNMAMTGTDPALVADCTRWIRAIGDRNVDIVLVPGEASWAWNWNLNRIFIPESAVGLDADKPIARAIACHEAGHSRWTRLHRFLDPAFRSGFDHQFFNTVEDCRVDSCLETHFFPPELVNAHRSWMLETTKTDGGDPPQEFLIGLLVARCTGEIPTPMHPDAEKAIRQVWPDFLTACQLGPVGMTAIDNRWRLHPCSAMFPQEKDAEERSVLMAQHDALRIWFEKLRPAFQRLLETHGGERMARRIRNRRRQMVRSGIAGDQPSAFIRSNSDRPYRDAVRNHGKDIELLINVLCEQLEASTAERGNKIKAMPRGHKFDLAAIMRIDAGGQAVDGPFVNYEPSKKPHVACHILVDSSASMSEGNRGQAALAALAIVAEALRAMNLEVLVYAFNTRLEFLASSGTAGFEIAASSVATPTHGGTDLSASLAGLDGYLGQAENIVLVFSDGNLHPTDQAEVVRWIQSREPEGVRAVVFCLDKCETETQPALILTCPEDLATAVSSWLCANALF